MSSSDLYKRARQGDIAYNMMRMWQGAVGVAPIDGLVSPAYVVARPLAGVDTRYYSYLFATPDYMSEVNKFSRGIVPDRNRLYWEQFKQMPSPVPPVDEQHAIVRFLDHLDRLVRRIIRAKRRQIDLLNEQKQAIIHQAVTRGLDPNVRLKPSGVEWLGDVPDHWQIKRLDQITNTGKPIMYGIVLPGPNVDDGVLIVKGGDCEPGRLQPERLSRTTFEIESHYARSRLAGGDIVVAIRGGVGAAELVPIELEGANLTQDAARISPGKNTDPTWLISAVRSPVFQEHVRSRVVGATVRGINIRDLKRIKVAVPPLVDQVKIARHVDTATQGVVAAASRAQQEISLVLEYRTRLIADVVTGKLDIRGVALPEVDDDDEQEPWDETAEFEASSNVDDEGVAFTTDV